MVFLLGVVVWAGCGGEVRTYRIAPYLEPGQQGPCAECIIALSLRATDELSDGRPRIRNFYPETFNARDFTFKWGVEQRVEIEVDQSHTVLPDDPGVTFIFRRVLEAHPVEPGARFTMAFPEAPPGVYSEKILVREGDGFLLQQTHRLECDSAELCEQLAARRPGEEGFALEVGYPETEGAPLRLHAIRDLP
jgi:hypothetical protein